VATHQSVTVFNDVQRGGPLLKWGSLPGKVRSFCSHSGSFLRRVEGPRCSNGASRVRDQCASSADRSSARIIQPWHSGQSSLHRRLTGHAPGSSRFQACSRRPSRCQLRGFYAANSPLARDRCVSPGVRGRRLKGDFWLRVGPIQPGETQRRGFAPLASASRPAIKSPVRADRNSCQSSSIWVLIPCEPD